MSSIHSPMQRAYLAQGSLEEESQEPGAIRQPPQMIMQQESSAFPFNPEDDVPFYFNLKQIQESALQVYQNFPLQTNRDFFDKNYEQIIKTSATQIEFLFSRLQQAKTGQDPSNQKFQKLFLENQQANSNIEKLKNSLTKADDIVKNLRIENEYFQRQLESLRKEVEIAQTQAQQSERRLSRAHSLERNEMGVTTNDNALFMASGNGSSNIGGGFYEPQKHLPQPIPHPRSNMHSLHDQFNNEDQALLNRRDLSQSPGKGVNNSNLLGKSQQQRSTSRGSITKSNVRSTATSANVRKPRNRQFTTALGQQDENKNIESTNAKGQPDYDQEIRTLRFELKQQNEVVALKEETVKNLQSQLEQQKRRMNSDANKVKAELLQDCDSLKKELELCKNEEVHKEATLSEFKRQVHDLIKCRGVEVNLLINKPLDKNSSQVSIEEIKEVAKKSKGNNKALKNLQFAKDLNAEMELMFADDSFSIKGNKKSKRNKQRQTQGGASDQASGVPRRNLPLQQEALLRNQIQAAQLSESLIEELKVIERESSTEVTNLESSCESLRVHAKTMMDEKNLLSDKVKDLSKINDDLKRKFSSLLDQFQEYVTVQESKTTVDDEAQKHQQEKLLTNMQDNIRELEHVTESLQAELQNKETVFEALKKENRELESKLSIKTQEEQQTTGQAMRRLEDEMSFIKKHHELELDMLKEQYERSIETAKLIAQETAKISGGGSHQQVSQDFQCNASQNESVRNSAYHGGHQYSQMHDNSPMRQRDQSPQLGNRAKDNMMTIKNTFEKLKKDLSEKEQILEDKNREILRLRRKEDEEQTNQAYQYKRNQRGRSTDQQPNSQIDCEKRGQLVADLNYNIDLLRTELTRVKQTMFQQIGKHINFDATTHLQAPSRSIFREEDLHSEVIVQLSEMRTLIMLSQEIGMLAQNQNPGNNRSSNSKSPLRSNSTSHLGANTSNTSVNEATYQVRRSADQMLRQSHTTGLHDLILEQLSRTETLMNDNALMQRQLYKYETTLSELDVILRGEKRDQTIFELKKLVESQLKQIIVLQKEVELVRMGQSSHHQERGGYTPYKDDTSAKEIESLRYSLSEQNRAYEEVQGERDNLLSVIDGLEAQARDSNQNLEGLTIRVEKYEKNNEDKSTEMEEIRERITKVAELFEKKQIGQKYSFEVLCDFIHDKAKRLYTKYENVSRERKVMQEEKSFYFQRKLEQLEQENYQMKDMNRTAERIMREVVPNLGQLLERQILPGQQLNEYLYARQVLEQLAIEYKTLKKAHVIQQERNNELAMQLDAFKVELSRQGTIVQGTIENCAPNKQGSLVSGSARMQNLNSSDHSQRGAQNIGNPHRHPVPRSPYDQKLSDAKVQEQQEIKAAVLRGNGSQGQLITGFGTIPRGPSDGVASPSRSRSPLRTGPMPIGTTSYSQHQRNKSIERDQKDSPPKQLRPTDRSSGVPYQNTMGTHLTTTQNNNNQ